MDGRAQLPDARGRWRAVLPLELPRAGHRRHRQGGVDALPRPDAVREEVEVLRPEVQEGGAALDAGGRAGDEEGSHHLAGRDAFAPRTRGDDRAQAREPVVDPARGAEALEGDRREGQGMKSIWKLWIPAFAGMTMLLAACAVHQPQSKEQVAAIVSAPDRTQADRENDARRKPAELLAFIGVRPGMTALDMRAARGYTTELNARAVGP